MLRTAALTLVVLTACACKRPVDPPEHQPAVPEEPVVAEDPVEPEEPPPPQLTPEILTEVQDDVHEVADRALGLAQTVGMYANRPSPKKLGKMTWKGATAQLSIDAKPVFETSPRTLPCHLTNVGPWRRAWTGKGGSQTRLDSTPQWWRFRASGEHAFIRVGATELTAIVYDATRRCWTAEDLVAPSRTRPAGIDFEDVAGSAGPGEQAAKVFGKDGELKISTTKISYFDGSSRSSFEPSDKATCAHAEWGKTSEQHWFRARFTSGEQADGCAQQIDDYSEEMIEVRDQAGKLLWASHVWAPGKGAPVGRATYTSHSPLGDIEVGYEVSDQHGAAEIPRALEETCKSVHRDNLSEPVVAAASERTLVGVWTIRRGDKEIASGVGTRKELELDCVPTD